MAEKFEYHTVEPGAPHVYHNDSDCPDGKRIKPEHYRVGRVRAADCARSAKSSSSLGKSFPSRDRGVRGCARPSSVEAP